MQVEPGDTCGPPAATSRPGDVVFRAGTVLGPAHLGVLASIDVRSTVRGVPPARGSACSPPATSWCEGPGRSRPGKIRDSNRPMLLALVARRGRRGRRPRASARDDEARDHARCSRAAVDELRRDHHERRGVGRRLRLRERVLERIAADDPRRRASTGTRSRSSRPKPFCVRHGRAARRSSACRATRCRRS